MDKEMYDILEPALDMLESMGLSVFTGDEDISNLEDIMPCKITVRECTDEEAKKCLAVDVTCLQEDAYEAPDCIRIMDIMKCVNAALDNNAQLNGEWLELIEVCACDSDYYYCSYKMLYGFTEEPKLPQRNCIDFYYEDFWRVMKDVFENDAVRDHLLVDGVAGSGLSLEELITQGYIRATNRSGVDDEENNVVIFLTFADYKTIRLVLEVFALGGDEETLDEHRQAVALAIDVRMRAHKGFDKLIEDCEHSSRMDTMVYSLGRSENAVMATEIRKQLNTHFFATTEVLERLHSCGVNNVKISHGFCVDLIDAPASLYLIAAQYGRTVFQLRRRNRVGDGDGECDLSIVTHAGMNKPTIQRDEGIDEEAMDTVMEWYKAMFALAEYIDNNDILDNYMDLNREGDGVLLYLEDNTIKHKLVSGATRPDMAMEAVGGGVAMVRPYIDELEALEDEGELNSTLESLAEMDPQMRRVAAISYMNGIGCADKNPERAAYWMEKAAKDGDAHAALDISTFYAGGFGVDRDFKLALEWAHKAVVDGYSEAEAYEAIYQTLVECQYYYRDENAENAKESYRRYAIALYKFAMMIGNFDVQLIFREVSLWAKPAMDADDGTAALILGHIYANGLAGEIDDAAAIDCFAQSYEMGNAAACNMIAQCYACGIGVDRNVTKAIEWYERYIVYYPEEEENTRSIIDSLKSEEE